MKTFCLKSLVFLVCFFAVERFCHKQTHGFHLQKIQSSLPFHPDWESELPSDTEMEEIYTALSQPYTFLDSGGQCYAFISKDEKTILKFFKHHHMRPTSWIDHIPLPHFFTPLRNYCKKRRLKRLNTLFESCKLANDRFKAGTGLLYLHLNKTEHLGVKLKFYDAIGAVHTVDLDTMEFALQKRASMAYSTLTELVHAGEMEAAKKRLDSLLNLIIMRCQAGIQDHDARKRNFGFVGSDAIELDLGSFTENEALKTPNWTKKTLLLETMKLRRFVKKNHPDLSEYLEENLKKRLVDL